MIPLFDAHTDIIYQDYIQNAYLLAENPNGHLDLARTEANFSPYAQFFATFADPKGKIKVEMEDIFAKQCAIFQEEMARNAARITFCRSAAEAREAFQRGRAAAFLSVEGADLLGAVLQNLDLAFGLGVRSITLTWNRANALSGSCVEDPTVGLSQLGQWYVEAMNELGMLVDVSHLSDPGFWDVIRTTKRPVMASHSNSRAVYRHPRNLTDDQFRALMENGGVAGLNLYCGFLGEGADYETLRRHLDHFLGLGGENHVALGGDWDGCDALPKGFEGGIAGLAGFYTYLKEKGYRDELLARLYFKNLMRVVENVCDT